MKKFFIKSISLTLIFSLALQLFFPLSAYALTTGPSQPEMQGFEPVGTTEMVDLFTGDFVYNIPLLDIDGYPINISYHSGVGMEQDASWVGLGWSLNPGEINRTVRGVPDDFNGDELKKDLNMAPETNFMGKVGAEVGAEIFGWDLKKYGVNLGMNLSLFMNSNNYKGLSAGLRAGVSASFGIPSSGNMNGRIGFSPSLGIGSQSGADIDASLSFSVSKSDKKNPDISTAASFGVGSGVNSRQGMSQLSTNVGMSRNRNYKSDKTDKKGREISETKSVGANFGSTVPIGIQNYVPVITNASILRSFYIQLKVGFEAWGAYPNFLAGVNVSKMKIEQDGTRDAFGYMYLENAPKNRKGVLDFIRDKDGAYNKTISYLPMSSLAYDIYSVSGQGTGGSFRPFRNDVGTVYDPLLYSSQDFESGTLELGFSPSIFAIGGDVNVYTNEVEAGPWVVADYRGDIDNTLYEKLFFKQGGELTYNQQQGTAASPNNLAFNSSHPLNVSASYEGDKFSRENNNVVVQYQANGGAQQRIADGMEYAGMVNTRSPRANLISVYNGERAANGLITHVNSSNNENKYQSSTLDKTTGELTSTAISRNDNSINKKRISYINQLLPDGRRYVYGIPAMNNISKDFTWGYNHSSTSGGMLSPVSIPDVPSGYNGLPDPEKYYSSSETPAYPHAFLLTEVLSPDYVDILGDGCSDDDLGGFVKFNYRRTSNDFRWRAPYKGESVHFDPGFQSDPRDGKANVSIGSREQWYVQTIESKNHVAEFCISPRGDAQGVNEGIKGTTYSSTSGASQESYKLDSIRLFNKNDRYLNQANAVPIKTIIFKYDYSLCTGTLNKNQSINPNGGKLTLRNIFVRYGYSNKNLLSPYQFSYETPNPTYDYGGKDRWGYAKVIDPDLNNFEFPYSTQAGAAVNAHQAASYNLTKIVLPSGGTINVEYEPDDYAYVQDKRAMEMAMIKGFGSTTNFSTGAILYENKDKQFNYLYIERKANDHLTGSSNSDAVRKRYFEDEKYIYYSVSTDIRGGAYEQIKGFAEIQSAGICPDNSQYIYVELKKTASSGIDFNPVALYAMNFAKYNLNHIFYPGYGSDNLGDVLKAFKSAAGELGHMRRPHQTYSERGYCKNIKLAKSWARIQSPTLAKKGGGVRVKKLSISDQWNQMTGSSVQKTGTYGREYDYTIADPQYGRISSGVASNEPFQGGDENPLRQPIPYTFAGNLALPAIEFYQLEPLGESFYPGGVVGYSSVKVRSIHIDVGKSSMSEEENLFYTAKDFPVRTEFSPKSTKSYSITSIGKHNSLEEASQGSTLFLNDMHGKPKAINNYIVKEFNSTDNEVKERELVNGVVYHYQVDQQGRLNNNVMTLLKDDGAYKVKEVELGKEVDLTFDSRRNYDNTESVGASINLNVMLVGVYTVPIPSLFLNYSQEKLVFHSMTATKIVQQYGILKKVENIDHGAKTIVENMVYDGESGGVVFSKVNNEYNDPEYIGKIPAFYGYEAMGPAYTNLGFKDRSTQKLYVNAIRDGFIQTDNTDKFVEGDELLYKKGTGGKKLWVVKKGVLGLNEYYGVSNNPNGYIAILPDPASQLKVYATVKDLNGNTVVSAVNIDSKNADDPLNLPIDASNLIELAPGEYDLEITKSGPYSLGEDPCTALAKVRIETQPGSLMVIVAKEKTVCNDDSPSGPFKWNFYPQYTDDSGKCCLRLFPIPENERCLLKVLPRYVDAHLLNVTNNTGWGNGGMLPEYITGINTEIIRSGKRNMLGNTLQEFVTTSLPVPAENTTLNSLLVSTALISASAQTYTDAAYNYEGYKKNVTPNSSGVIVEGFNDFVMGLRGNFRPLASMVPLVSRSYTKANPPNTQPSYDMIHSRKDGTFSLSGLFWKATLLSPCAPQDYLAQFPSSSWQAAATVTKYDMYGNSLEEKDATGIYTTAQYGFNQKLPIAISQNAQQGSTLFESFEDLNSILLPEGTRRMFYNFSYTSTAPSAYLYGPIAKVISSFTSGTPETHGNQNYYRLATTQSGTAVTINTTEAHSGYRSLSINGGGSFSLGTKTGYSVNQIDAFNLLKTKKYLFQFWQKASGTAALYRKPSSGSPVWIANFTPVGNPINDWQLMQLEYDVNTLPAANTLSLEFSGSMKVDDLRILPIDAAMKTFVYDPLNNRLKAQLDENHYATFYEYDAEGQLVRVKKETEKGIITIKETRRSNIKNF